VAVLVPVLVAVADTVDVPVDVGVISQASQVPGHSTLRISPIMVSSQSSRLIDRHLSWSTRPLQNAVVTVEVAELVCEVVADEVCEEVTVEVADCV